ncbi:heterokaryon incompatibility protein-domain-containing protein [Ilyonectria robusta]|uniref:heterokaryon incompatibility protein-domain-containing protein n=1 Tax=Ilyonectria robusta TaxID=1079257 RepID=UPI001E8DF51E|nr:heterokaryon incompatibility protein-domain-containing protein [Ilyonectria robusta]KAH8686168.1 heterokaryon incompatibility protein-domain-containing protein [Ilyonectria robusta]
MASLCALCESMSYEALPDFPDENYMRTLSGYANLQHLIVRKSKRSESLGFKHHPDLESLRHSAKEGCDLCQLIEAQADDVLSDFEKEEMPLLRELGIGEGAHLTFDLWVTKRPDGQDGILVVTNCSWEPGVKVVPVAAIAFCAQQDGPLAEIIKGHVISDTPDEIVLSRICGWVAACDKHDRCAQQDRTMPTRVIDVGDETTGNSVKLVETTVDDQERYIALSYCWGIGTKQYVTTEAIVAERKQGIDVSTLPKTFQDAIALSRQLGVRYIWIDSLCICQDQIHEWERESTKMAAVYTNAYLTVAATGVDSSDGGLFFSRNPPRSIELPYISGETSGTVLVHPLPFDREIIKQYHTEMRDEPLTQRAWGFQERVLSRRILHFAKHQVYYECIEGTQTENGLTLPDRFQYAYDALDKTKTEMIEKTFSGKPRRKRSSNEVLQQWYGLLWGYGGRKLTWASDKLPAMSGLARIYHEILQDEYLAGVWKTNIVEGICWQGLDCSSPPNDEYRAPSWSWASVDGIAATGFSGNDYLATAIDSHVEVDGENPFGKVKNGWLRLKAPLVPLTLSDTKGPTGHMFLRTLDGDEGCYAGFDVIDRNSKVSAEKVRAMQLFALIMVRTAPTEDDPDSTYFALIVEPAGSEMETFRRIGFLLCGRETFGPNDLDKISEVKLV